jgi:RNA polymerase sigma-70 factor (ECF subfamily)
VIRSFTNDHDDTDDLLQETFVKAYEHLDQFRGDSSLYTWLCRIAINQSITYQRKKKLRNFINLDNLSIPLISKQSDPQQKMQETELKELIQQAVEQLSEKQKTVFNLRFYDELSHAEIAKITGNSVGTIKANFFHAIQKVKMYLDNHYTEK